ncbi:MAG: hypothetical protein ABW215_10755 [Kibdelosporangium sp.]
MRLGPLVMVAAMAAAWLAAIPALADPVEVEAAVVPEDLEPGVAFTVTETVHNVHQFSVLNPTLRLFGTPAPLPSYAELVGCAGADAICATVDGPDGPIGFQAILPGALSGFESATVVFTLRVKADAVAAGYALQGQLLGRNYGIAPQDVASLTVVDEADAAVGLTATPNFGLLVPRLEVTVRVTNNGPARLRSTEVRGALTQGLSSNAGSECTGGAQPVCAFGELASGASATGSFSVPLGLLHIGLSDRISASKASSSPADPVPGNDSAGTTCTVTTPLLVGCR